MSDQETQDFAEMINQAAIDGWAGAMGLRFMRATRDEVVAELTIGPQHRQPYGLVHGGVHSGIIETIASVGAAVSVMPEGKHVVGLDNHTSFLRAVRGGKLTGTAKPIARGRRSHVWEGSVHDDAGRLVASGRVRLLVLDGGEEMAGERVGIDGGGAKPA